MGAEKLLSSESSREEVVINQSEALKRELDRNGMRFQEHWLIQFQEEARGFETRRLRFCENCQKALGGISYVNGPLGPVRVQVCTCVYLFYVFGV